MRDILNLLMAPITMGLNYDQRRVANNKLKNGLVVDTAYTPDMGYETAIQDGSGSWHPVERYSDKKASEKGHKKWIKYSFGEMINGKFKRGCCDSTLKVDSFLDMYSLYFESNDDGTPPEPFQNAIEQLD